MSFRQSSEETRWLVVSTYTQMKRKNPAVTPTKVWNHLKFNGHSKMKQLFVIRTLERYKSTGGVADRPQDSGKRKIADSLKKSVVKHVKNKKKPKYMRSSRKTAQLLHGPPQKKRKISHTSVQNIMKESGNKYRRTTRRPVLTNHHIRMRYL